jgi:hypothetical protein
MSRIVFVIDDSMSYDNLNKNRLGLVKFLKQKGLPIIMSYVEDPRQNDLVIEKPCQNDMTTSDLSGANVATSTTPDVSGA